VNGKVQTLPAKWQRFLLPGDLVEANGPRSARDWLTDTVLFVAAIGVGASALNYLWASRGAAMNVLDLTFGSAACISLWFRRSRPITVALFATAASALFALASGAALIGIFNAAIRGRVRYLPAVAATALAGSAIFPLINDAAPPLLRQRFPGFMFTAIAFGWGLFVRARHQLIVSLRERADQLEADQERNIEHARDMERKRIAREMHDVLAHRLSLLSVHAGALEYHPDATPNEIATAASVIRTAAAAALDELRAVVALLRDQDATGGEPPQPTLNGLHDLIEESRAAGMTIQETIETPEPLADSLGRTAYRIVQEGLTNARKHAPGAAVEIAVRANGNDQFTVEIITRAADRPRNALAPVLAGGGTGLVGLGERVALVSGALHHGHTENGDYVLRAILPRQS